MITKPELEHIKKRALFLSELGVQAFMEIDHKTILNIVNRLEVLEQYHETATKICVDMERTVGRK